jgi:Cu(I)/Ag(I) efflux system membrane fusion protein
VKIRTVALVAVTLLAGVAAGRWVLPRAAAPAAAPGHAEHAAPAGQEAAAVAWTCSMHPQIRQDRPGRCPLCGMDLVPASAGADGDPTVVLSASAQRIASIEVARLERRPLVHELRTVGRIEFAEPLLAYLTARVAARVERVYADFTGTVVAQGDHLVDIYSPELVVAQQELLSAGPNADAAREKLLLLGVTAAQIEDVLASGAPRTVLTLHAPIGGTVIDKAVREQMYLEVGDPLYTIADLSTVWLYADIYEYELPWVAIGQAVDVTVEGAPGETFAGTVAFVEPVVREATRTVRVRVNLPNADGRLRPGMFAKAVIRAVLGPDGRRAPSPLAGKWVCPMHPDVAQDTHGECPLCGMDLLRVAGEAPGDPHAGHGAPAPQWACPMACEPPRDAPGRCSVCGMHLQAQEAPEAGPDGALLLAVPATAVLDSGLRQVVWVEREPGRYEAAEVRLGPRAGDHYPVLSGLSEGERVVVHGAFLLDSQAQIEGRPSLLFPRGIEAGPPPAGHAGHTGG